MNFKYNFIVGFYMRIRKIQCFCCASPKVAKQRTLLRQFQLVRLRIYYYFDAHYTHLSCNYNFLALDSVWYYVSEDKVPLCVGSEEHNMAHAPQA